MAKKLLYINHRLVLWEVWKAKPLCTVKQGAKESHQNFIRRIHSEILHIEDHQDSTTLEVFERDPLDNDLSMITVGGKSRSPCDDQIGIAKL